MDPQILLEDILAEVDPNSPRVGTLTNKLLEEFQQGYPLDNLRLLLRSENERLVNTGIWIASELGEWGKPLLNDVSPLLKHPAKRVRYFAIDCILLWAAPPNRFELASVVALMDDSEAAVRMKAMDFLCRASKEQLLAGLAYLEDTEPESTHIRGLHWFLGSSRTNPKEVISALQSAESLCRKYGVVAATQMSKENMEPLLYASSMDDPDVKRFTERHAAIA